MKHRMSLFALLALVIAAAMPAQAQVPAGPGKFVVGFAPGGGNDILARIIAEKLSASLGNNFIVDNRPGGNGILAIEAAKRSEPNGLTILVGPSSGMTFNPIVLKSIPYDPVKDFDPIALVGSFPLVVVVNADSPLKTLQDLVSAAKAKPGEVNYSSAATSFRVATEAFAQRAGVTMMNVPYRGSAPAATAIMTKDVAVNFGDISAVLPLIEGSKLRALAVTTAKRIPSLPDTPTIAESGYAEFEMVFWSGLFVPAGTPEPIRSRLQSEIEKIVAMPDVVERMRKLGIEPTFMPGEQLRTKIANDIKSFRKIADSAGITPE